MTLLHIPIGCYELKAINAEITRICGNSDITILPNVNTLQCILTVVGVKCKVSFDVPNSLLQLVLYPSLPVYYQQSCWDSQLVYFLVVLTK